MRAPRYFDPSHYVATTEPEYIDELDAYSPYYYGTGTAVVTPYRPQTLAEIREDLRAQLLELNRQIAGRFGLDPRYTISTNIGIYIAQLFGMEFSTAKRIFHGGVAGVVGAIIAFFGAPFVATVGLGALFYAWLESFDSAAFRQ